MLIDLLSSSNQISFNSLVAEKLGLHAAIYISELMTINEKALRKGKFETITGKNYFTVDRQYIKKRITLSETEQRQLDVSLSKSGIIYIKADEIDTLFLDINALAVLLGAELDMSVVNDLTRLSKKQTKEEKDLAKKRGNIYHAQLLINVPNATLKGALFTWIDNCVEKYGYLTDTTVKMVLKQLNDFAPDNYMLQTEIVNLNPNGYNTMEYAINKYKELHPTFNSKAGHEVALKRVVNIDGEVF